ncbi:MAG: lipopolysaccharide assembly protein LapB [Candidatus Thiosymbion ectosymbiont of Robbea hypermnestra]|nr:lipopolysaccharide assembly protein LapB [Candidatus Thiosymbion ectosymbiont of Robbea hypermnestra]
MIEWLFLLLPLAAASGWWAAKRVGTSRGDAGPRADSAFLRGLNFLLDEQPDKAIDLFVRLAEVDEETTEVQLALGSLFRRRGEVDRAIHIHQGLISRPDLGREERGYALFELGQDYMRAGLFDRAENIFDELVEMKLHRERALEKLREIYQQEKDWARCLEIAGRLRRLTGEPMGTESAQYHCELAEEALKRGQGAAAVTQLHQARAADPACVRATILQARMAMDEGDSRRAAVLYGRVVRQGPQFLPEILPELVAAYRRSHVADELGELRRLYRIHPSPRLVTMLAERIQEKEGDEAAIAFLVEHVTGRADLVALERLLALRASKPADAARTQAVLRATRAVIEHLGAHQPDYRCGHCGFVARRLHWQCPSCGHWKSIEPIQPAAIDNRTPALPSDPTVRAA